MYLHCVLTLLALFGIPVLECLQCFNCQNSNDPKCTGRVECLDNQSCFVQTVHSGNEVLYNMGCHNNQLCSSLRVDHSEIIGRSVQTRQQNRCHECCSTDYCNEEQLCAHREESAGRQFIFGIPETHNRLNDYIKLYIASKDVSKVYITAPGIGFNQTITTLANTSTAVAIPGSIVTTTGLSNKAVYVESDQTISIYVMVREIGSSDGLLLLPIADDAPEFFVASYEPIDPTDPSQFLIIALEDSTLIDIQLRTSAGPVIIGSQSYSSGQNVSLTMSKMQTYLVQHEHDLTGTHITSSKPVSVVSGTKCANVPHDATSCDFLVEQMLPVSFWQREYVCAKLKSRGTNRLRILSSVDGTSVNIGATHIKLNKGEFYEHVNSNDVATPIESNFPVLVLQYAEGGDHDSKIGDPSMITIPSINSQEAEYFYETATPLPYHYVSITIRTDQANGLHIDGSTVSRSDELKTRINTTEFSIIRLSVTVGKHHIYHVDTTVGFGVIVYGFDAAESYGFPLGLTTQGGPRDTVRVLSVPDERTLTRSFTSSVTQRSVTLPT